MYLYQVRDFVGTTVVQTFGRMMIQQDFGVSRRSGSFAIYGVDGAINPYGARAAPLAKHDFSCQFRVLTGSGNTQTFQHAYETLMRNVGHGRPQTLVRRMDDGTLQFNVGYFVDAPLVVTADSSDYQDFRIIWELDDPRWRSQYPPDTRVWGVNPPVWGDPTPLIWGDTSFPLPTATTSHALATTGGVAFGVPTADEDSARFLIVGPFGGADGFTVYNDSILVDSGAGMVPMQFSVNEKVAAGVHYEIACAAQSVRKDGQKAYSHFSVPLWQDEWMRIQANTVNNFRYVSNGAAPVTGGRASIIGYYRFY